MSSISKSKRIRIYKRDGGRCMYCGSPVSIDESVLDHIHARVRGGKNHDDNLRLSCAQCNGIKGSGTVEEFRQKLQRHAADPDPRTSTIGRITGVQLPRLITFCFERGGEDGAALQEDSDERTHAGTGVRISDKET